MHYQRLVEHTLLIITAMVLVVLCCPAVAQEPVAIEWHVPREQVSELRYEMEFEGEVTPDLESRDDTKGLPAIYVLAGLVALPNLVIGIRTAVRDALCGGVIVEDTDDGLAVRCERSLGVGTVVIKDAGGVRVEHFEQVPDAAELLQGLKRLKGAT